MFTRKGIRDTLVFCKFCKHVDYSELEPECNKTPVIKNTWWAPMPDKERCCVKNKYMNCKDYEAGE